MRSSNPVFSREGAFTRDTRYAGFGTAQRPSGHGFDERWDQPAYLTDQQLREMYGAPSAGPLDTGRMTMDDVVARTALTLLTLLAGAAATWILLPAGTLGFAGFAALAAFAVGMVVTFRRSVSPPLVLLYAALEGVALGGVSRAFETALNGIVLQAVLGTAAVFAAMLLAYRSGRIRVTPRYARAGLAVAMGFVILLAVDLLAGLFRVDLGLGHGPLGIVVGLVGVCLGAFFLTLDFAAIEEGIRGGAPQREAWRAAFGLTLSLVWIYLELLRLIAILRGDD